MKSLQPNGAVIQYDIQYRSGTSSFNVTFTCLTGTVTGLTSNTAYEFRVAATNRAGRGSYSSLLSQGTGEICKYTYCMLGITDSWDLLPKISHNEQPWIDIAKQKDVFLNHAAFSSHPCFLTLSL